MEKRHRQLLSLVILGVALGMVLHAVVMAYMVNVRGSVEYINDAGRGTINTDIYPEKRSAPIMSA